MTCERAIGSSSWLADTWRDFITLYLFNVFRILVYKPGIVIICGINNILGDQQSCHH